MNNYWRLGWTQPSKNTFYKFFRRRQYLKTFPDEIIGTSLFREFLHPTDLLRKSKRGGQVTQSVWRILPPPPLKSERFRGLNPGNSTNSTGQNAPNTKSRIRLPHKMLAAQPACPPAQAGK